VIGIWQHTRLVINIWRSFGTLFIGNNPFIFQTTVGAPAHARMFIPWKIMLLSFLYLFFCDWMKGKLFHFTKWFKDSHLVWTDNHLRTTYSLIRFCFKIARYQDNYLLLRNSLGLLFLGICVMAHFIFTEEQLLRDTHLLRHIV
jgi:hypothetical protein